MSRMAGVALVASLIASGGQGSAYQTGVIPIRVSSVETDDAQQAVSFVLENIAAQTITAWNVRVQVGTTSASPASTPIAVLPVSISRRRTSFPAAGYP